MASNILVVEDELIIARDIRRILMDFGYDVPPSVASGRAALDAVEKRRPDLVLMDIRIAGPLDGIQTAGILHEKHRLPVIYLTSHSDEATLARARATGPYGYIVKPFTERELRTSIEVALGRHELDSARIEAGKRETERLLAAARTDPLTEAANRLRLQEDLEGVADRAQRYGHEYCAAFCDIDAFKSYNDTFGHLAGDIAIRIVSQTIRAQLRRGDSFYRYGGDEFLVVLPEQSLSGASECLERVRLAVASIPVAHGGLLRPVTMSGGIAAFRKIADRDAIQSWLERTDAALYRAKGRGRNCVETDCVDG